MPQWPHHCKGGGVTVHGTRATVDGERAGCAHFKSETRAGGARSAGRGARKRARREESGCIGRFSYVIYLLWGLVSHTQA